MIRLRNIVIALLTSTLLVTACEEFKLGEFSVDDTMIPEATTDVPGAPSVLVASYDEFCDKVEVKWTPTVRTTTYDLYKNDVLVGQGLTDTIYVDTDANLDDTEYKVVSKNSNGESESSASAIGRMADTPETPTNFNASDGEYESKVELSWDEAKYAKYYKIYRGTELLADDVTGTVFADAEAPQTSTEYSIIAVSVCGESAAATEFGHCDPLVAFNVPIDISFESYSTGELSDVGDFNILFAYNPAPNPNGVIEIIQGDSKYMLLRNVNNKQQISLSLPEVTLLVGESYTLTFDYMTNYVGNLFIGFDGSGNGALGQDADNYLIPDATNPKNANSFGVKIGGGAVDEWKPYSYNFPATGTAANQVDPSTADWVIGPIQEGEESPTISFNMYRWKANASFAIDNIKLERIR